MTMKPDMRTWVEAAISKHLRDDLPLDQSHASLVHGVLAQLLRYWRYDVPGDWGDLLDNAAYSITAWQIKERASMAMGERDVDAYAPDVITAIGKGEWDALAALPDAVWGWVHEMTGLSRAEWGMVPETAAEVLRTELECPRCKSQGPLHSLLRMREGAEPVRLTSTGAVHFTCGRCGSGLTLDLSEPRIPDFTNPSRGRKSLLALALPFALAIVVLYLIVRYFL